MGTEGKRRFLVDLADPIPGTAVLVGRDVPCGLASPLHPARVSARHGATGDAGASRDARVSGGAAAARAQLRPGYRPAQSFGEHFYGIAP